MCSILSVLVVLVLCLIKVLNGAAPSCSANASVSITYDTAVGSVIQDLQCNDVDGGDTLTYSFISENSQNQFTIDNGLLKLAKRLGITSYKFVVEIKVSDSIGNFVQKITTIEVTSVNEFPPVVQWPTFNVPESAPIGTLIGKCIITDGDEVKGTLAGQTVINFLNPRVTAANKWILDRKSCEFYLNQNLNYAKKRLYKLNMMAFDLDPYSPRNTTGQFIINVLDSQDQPTCTEYLKVIPTIKSTSVGTQLTTVRCQDSDEGANGQLTYELDSNNTLETFNMFDINPTTGSLYLRSLIYNGTIPFYEVLINVKDGGSPSMSNNVLVRVIVTDVPPDGIQPTSLFTNVFSTPMAVLPAPIDLRSLPDLPKPTIDGQPYCPRYALTATVPENKTVNFAVYDLGCKDPEGDTLRYRIVRGNVFTKFKMVGSVIRLNKGLDADARNFFHLRISVTDDSPMFFSTTVTVAVRITGINDNPPKFKTPIPTIQVSEDDPIGTIVYTCPFTDKDKSTTQEGQVRFSWADPDDKQSKDWTVDPVTCSIYIQRKLNFQTVSKYSLNLKAVDLDSSSPQTAVTSVTINVSDAEETTTHSTLAMSTRSTLFTGSSTITYINNYTPVIKNLTSHLDIEENTPIGTLIASCYVEDEDEGTLASQTVVDLNKPNILAAKRWVIDSKTCNIYLNTELNYEVKMKYVIGLIAKDLDPIAPRTATHKIVVNVLDVNDNPPICDHKAFNLIYVKEDEAINTRILRLSCSDSDSGNNTLIFFKLSDNNKENVNTTFQMNTFGELYLQQQVDYESQHLYEVRIDVYDGGSPSLTTSVLVSVVVSDVDDNIPTWSTSTRQESVNETVPIGTIVFNISATDRDQPKTHASKITYKIESISRKWFDVIPDIGAVKTTSLLDWTIEKYVSMNISAYSSNRDYRKSFITVNITINDENNIAPEFTMEIYKVFVEEDTPVGTSLTNVSAFDPESGDNGRLTYETDAEKVEVDAVSGVISLRQTLNFTADAEVSAVWLRVHDHGTPRLVGYSLFQLIVLPINSTPTVELKGVLINSLDES